MRVLGIDPSFSATGWCLWDDGDITTGRLSKYPMNVRSARGIAADVKRMAINGRADIVAIESPILNHIAGAETLMGMAGLAWLIRAEIQDHVHYVDIRPQDRMLWATGKGNATKHEVLAAAQADGFQGGGFDEADAWVIASIARTAYAIAELANGAPVYNLLHVGRCVVLGRIVWPRLGDVKPEFPARVMPTKPAKPRKRSSDVGTKRT